MATLFQTSSQLRRVLVFVVLGIILILVIDNVSKYLNSPGNIFSPTTTYFQDHDSNLGTIPVPTMASFSIASDSQPTFVLNGQLPVAPNTAVVYTIEKPREKLDTVDSAVSTAIVLGFTGSYTNISADEISWLNPQNTRTLTFNKVTQEWRLRTKYPFDAAAQSPKSLNTDIKSYNRIGTTIANRLGFADKSLQQGQAVSSFALLGTDGLFTAPLDPAAANYVSIDIFRDLELAIPKTLADMPSGYKQSDLPDPVNGLVYHIDPLYGSARGGMHLIVSNSGSDLTTDVYEMDFINYIYNYTGYSVRDIITPSEAWDLIRKQAKGTALTVLKLDTADYFAQNQSLKVSKFTADATQTKLGYFEPSPWDGFVYPVYIFTGKADTDKGTANFTFFADALRRF